MSNLPLTFPVFYHCAIKKTNKRTQKDAVNLLLTGYPADTPGFSIAQTLISNYVSGRKPLAGTKVNELQSLPTEVLSERFKALNLFNVFATRDAVIQLLDVVSMDPSIKEALLQYNEPGEEYDFLSEVFRTAVNAPNDLIVPLTPEDLGLIQSCRSPYKKKLDPQPPQVSSPTTEQEAPFSPSPEQKPPVRNIGTIPPAAEYGKTTLAESYLKFLAEMEARKNANPLEGMGSYEDFLLTRTLTPSAYVSKEDFIDAFHSLIDGDEPAFLPIDYADISMVAKNTAPENLFVLECMGREEEVLHYLTRQPCLAGVKQAAMISVLSPESSLELMNQLTVAVQESLGHDWLVSGTRLSEDFIGGFACVRLLLAR